MNVTMARSVAPGLRALAWLVLGLHAAAALASGNDAGAGRERLTPAERQQLWRQLTPEQREAFRDARTPEERQRAWQGLSPEQRRDIWQGLTPEQRELLLRRIPRDERRQMWEKMSPEEREAMRQRFLQQREQRQAGPGERPRLTPEERQRLRDQIRESQGSWKGAGPRHGAPKDAPR